jgi:hypothetical protein
MNIKRFEERHGPIGEPSAKGPIGFQAGEEGGQGH